MHPGRAPYLFCCASSDRLPAKLEIEGLDDGTPLLQQRYRDLAAVMSEVSLDEFTGPEAQARLSDLGWLAPRALRHEQIIEEIARHSPVFPARFGTIFSSLDSLAALLARHHDTIRAFLDRTTNAEEWGVKGYLDRNQARERLVEEELAGPAARLSSSPGTRFMQERKLRAQAEAKVGDWLRQTSARLKEELAHRALDAVERRLLAAGSTGTPGEMVLNWAFLVPKPEVEAFRSAGEQLGHELSDRGLVFEIAGPFPPFSFTPGLDEKQA
ncbi:MAG: GvpL/GvpF family gas vesicle protein [Deltaproteobacteria bacterium]|nr:GvpL/GvpF family gas vesicle protein [Deltaproteobacteria bacterium]